MTASANASSEATKFPSFTGKDLDGNDVSSDELFSKNKVTVMNFWFTTCKPCVGELGDLENLNKGARREGRSGRRRQFLYARWQQGRDCRCQGRTEQERRDI